MLRNKIWLVLILCCSGFASFAHSEDSTPTIPISALYQYKVSDTTERIEGMDLRRVLLSGKIDAILDPINDHVSVPTGNTVSARFIVPLNQAFSVEILSFPKSEFHFELSDSTLNDYLRGLRDKYTVEQNYQITESAAFTENGPAKFRIFGQRARTIGYSYDVLTESKIDAEIEIENITVGENWIERKGTIHIVRIIAPSSSFDFQYSQIKRAFNSIVETD